jgi:O-antigen biosynthesis protein
MEDRPSRPMRHEMLKIWKAVRRRYTDPENNEMGLAPMTWYYVLRKIADLSRKKVLIEVPLENVEMGAAPGRIAVIVHCFYVDLVDEILDALTNIPFPFQLYLSTDTVEKRDVIVRTLKARGLADYDLRVVPNRGLDIAPKYVAFRDVYGKCDYFLHLHTKQSGHLGKGSGKRWREHLLGSLLGSREIVLSIFALLRDPRVGLVFPDPFDPTIPTLRWGKNYEVSLALAQRLQVKLEPECPEYPSGSMFWAKASLVQPLLDLNLQFEDFTTDNRAIDGQLAHALERMIVPVANAQNLYGLRIATSQFGRRHQAIRVASPAQLRDAITTCLENERLG